MFKKPATTKRPANKLLADQWGPKRRITGVFEGDYKAWFKAAGFEAGDKFDDEIVGVIAFRREAEEN